MPPVWTVVFFLASLPFCILCGAYDLTRMRIPNWVVLGLFASFVLLAPFALGPADIGVRLLQAAAILALGFGLTTFFGIGGGDGKFAAACAAFIAPGDYGVVMVSLGVMSLLAVALHRAAGRVPALNGLTRDWASYSDPSKFPFGLPLAATLAFYNLLQVARAWSLSGGGAG